MSSNRLSHSAVSRFQDCAKSYEFHYIKKLRPATQSAALFFGSAVDAAFTVMVDPKPNDKSPKETFDYIWRFQALNGKQEYLPTSIKIVYSNTDFDKDLLTKEQIDKLVEEYKYTDVLGEIAKIYEEKDVVGWNLLRDDRKTLFNHANWMSLQTKGHLMLEALEKQVVPNLVEVLGTQVKVDLQNGEGDSIIGYADLVAKWKGYDKPIIFDLKTSSILYDKDSVLVSPQLTLYVHSLSEQFENTRSAGFLVLNKRVNKNKTKACSLCGKDGTGQRHKTCDAQVGDARCNGTWTESFKPEVFMQVIINDIPEQTEEIVLENYDHINTAIKTQVFPRSFGSCVKPWGKCTFYKKCFHGKDDELVDQSLET